MKLLQSVYVTNGVTVLIASINIKGLTIRYRKTSLCPGSGKLIIVNIWFTIVPPGLEPPLLFLREPPFFWSKFKKLPLSFWDPSKLAHANGKKHFKMKVLRFILSIVTILSQSLLTLLILLSGSTLYLLLILSLIRYCHCFSYLTWMRNEHETFLKIRLLNLICI